MINYRLHVYLSKKSDFANPVLLWSADVARVALYLNSINLRLISIHFWQFHCMGPQTSIHGVVVNNVCAFGWWLNICMWMSGSVAMVLIENPP